MLREKKIKNSTAVNHDHQGEVVYFWIVCFSSDKMIMAEKNMFFKYSETVTMWNINAQIWKSSFHECTSTSLKRELYENSSDSDDCQKACWLIMNIKFRKKSRSSTRKYKHKKIFYHKLPLFLDAARLHQRRGDFFGCC